MIYAYISRPQHRRCPLQYRPDHYVPIRVPIFDEAATQNARNSNVYNQQDNQPYQDKVAAIYRWPYRPEMQFSVWDFSLVSRPPVRNSMPVQKTSIF